MKVIEILNLSRKTLEILQKACIKIGDVQYVDLFNDYEAMARCGTKKAYVIAVLAEKYGISERQAYYLIKRFGKDCKIDAGTSQE